MPNYKLEKVDSIPGRSKDSLYKSILDEFVGSDSKAAQVKVEDRKPISVYQGLVKAKKSFGVKVQIRQRSQNVYLVKENAA